MGLRARVAQFRQEWAAAGEAVDQRLARRQARGHDQQRRAAQPSGTCDQNGCSEPTYGNNRTCNTHIAGMGVNGG